MLIKNPSSARNDLLRVAYVVHTFDIGGLERCVAHLCNGLDRVRFRPMIICLNRNGTASEWIRSPDVSIVEFHKRPSNDPRVVVRLARLLREQGIHLVHSQNWCTLVETTLARTLARTRWHVHGEQGLELSALQLSGCHRRLRNLATRWALGRADAVVAVANSLKQRMTRHYGVREQSVQVVPNGVAVPYVKDPTRERVKIRHALGIDRESTILLGSVGRLAPVKDFATAINAVAILVERGCDVHLMIVGEGPEQANLMDRSSSAGLAGRVHFVGRKTEVGAYFASMDIYVNSSISEGTSLSIMEAMASGLPSVVTDAGDNSMLVHGHPGCGEVVPPRDPIAMAHALENLVRDEQRRIELGATARKRHAEKFSADHTVRMYQHLYMSLHD